MSTPAVRLSSAPTRCREQMRDHVRRARRPMLLLELPSGRALEISDPMVALLGRTRAEAMRMRAADLTENPAATQASLQMLSDGTLDGYTRRVRVLGPDRTSPELQVRVDACDNRGPDRLAVVSVLPTEDTPTPSGPPVARGEAGVAVSGTITASGIIDRIVSEDTQLLPERPERLLDRQLLDLVHPDDIGVITMLTAHSSARSAAVTGRTRLRGPNGGWQLTRIALQPLATPTSAPHEQPGFAFVLSPEPTRPPARNGTVETFRASSRRNQQQLRAASVAAHLFLIDEIMTSPSVMGLSQREREIVTRILSGHRVRTIARELYLSQSTVRNHLTGVYRKLGVNSQIELLELLRPDAQP